MKGLYSDTEVLHVEESPFSRGVVLVHNTRSKDSGFMHKLSLSLHAMNRLVWRERVYMVLITSLDNSNGA